MAKPGLCYFDTGAKLSEPLLAKSQLIQGFITVVLAFCAVVDSSEGRYEHKAAVRKPRKCSNRDAGRNVRVLVG